MVAIEGDEEEIGGKEKNHADDHGQEHEARGGCTNVDPVPQEGRHATQRKKQSPMPVTGYCIQYLGIVSEKRHEPLASQSIQYHKEQCHYPTPLEESSHHGTADFAIDSTYGLAHKRLAGIGKTVHKVTEDGEHLHEQRIDRQFHTALRCSGGNEHEVHYDKAKGAQEQGKVLAVACATRSKCLAQEAAEWWHAERLSPP